MKRIYLLLTAILLVAFTTYADVWQRFDTGPNDYHINKIALSGDLVWCATNTGVFSFNKVTKEETRYRKDDGLLEDMSLHITTAGDGDVWVLSESGASCRDDGQWQVFPKQDYFDGITPLSAAADTNGVLWLTFDDGVRSYDGHAWTFHTTEGLTDVLSVAVDSTNVKWFGTDHQGLFSFDGELWGRNIGDFKAKMYEFTGYYQTTSTDNFSQCAIKSVYFANNTLCLVTDDMIYVEQPDHWEKREINASDICNTIYYDCVNLVYYGNNKKGLRIMDMQHHYDYDGNLASSDYRAGLTVLSLHPDTDGSVWIGYDRKLCRYNIKTLETYLECTEIMNEIVHDLAISPGDDIWCITKSHEYTYENGEFVRTALFNAFPSNTYGKGRIIFDSNGIMYFFVSGQICKYENGSHNILYGWSLPNTYGSLSDCAITADNSLILTLSTPYMEVIGGGYGVYNGHQLYTQQDLTVKVNPTILAYISKGIVNKGWVSGRPEGFDEEGIYSFDFDVNATPPLYNFQLVPGYKNTIFHNAGIDKAGILWHDEYKLGTSYDVGLVSTNGDIHTYYTAENSPLPSNTIQCLAIDKTNAKWIGTDKGLACFDDENWEVFTTENSGLIDDDVTAIAFTSDNTVWIGTASGVCVYTGDQVVSVEDDYGAEVTPEARPLVQVHPNPFNPVTTIRYELAKPAQVNLSVYSIAGQKVATLIDAPMTAGRHEAIFDGAVLASGVYVYRLDADGAVTSGKMLMVR